MKQTLLMAFFFHIIASGASYAKTQPKSLLNLNFIATEAAAKKWGDIPFSPQVFKNAGEKKRASMVADLVRSKQFVGKRFSEIRQELGEWDGYFQTDSIPAYSIESANTGSKEAWLVVFLPDASGKKVGEIKILKECCN